MNVPRRLGQQDGASLVELLTALAVSAVVLAFVTGTVIHALRSQDRQVSRVEALNEVKVAFERTTRDIRAADPLRLAGNDRVDLDVDTGTGTTRTVTYEHAGDELIVTDAASGQPRTMVGDLVSGLRVFQYHLVDGSTATGEAAVDPRLVRSITMRLRVEPDGAASAIDLKNRVLLRNAD